ncbi:DUF364 domain-containing protein [Natroniella acetigena]|uniref:Rossmann-like domain-containing protein n=1 Tax=Natroniella acetigena TaxID=52004 RepID=UPI00200AB40F|nr:DUF364 domain-containing protein [Natroniella acetigena]MCK8828532.1 DUF364 domain-containing protein [Natroniella acetigena]
MGVLEKAKERFEEIIIENQLLDQAIMINARGLSTEEAIGNPKRGDFPLIQGQEVMIQAEFNGSYGQSFTDHPGNFKGSLQEVIDLSLDNNYHRALLVATINAVLRNLDLAEKTVHCKDEEPELCACEIVMWIENNFNNIDKIGIIGYQPAILEECTKVFGAEKITITDLNQEKIGIKSFGVEVWDGRKDNERLIREADLILFTGSSIINGSIDDILDIINSYNKDYFIFGNTISGVVSLLELPQLCFYGR